MTVANKRKKVLFFYNPYAGNGMLKNNIDLIIERFQEKDLQIVPIRAAKGFVLEQAIKEMNQEEYRQIIIAGGDGSINMCVNFMIKNNIDLPLAIFPTGTANDFAYYFSLSKDIDDMIEVALGDNKVEVDVGVCNDRYFINVAAIGNLVDVSQKTDPNLKNTLGVLSYYLKGMTEIVNLKPLAVKLITETETFEENMYFMVVMNGKSAGGFKKISPESEISDGLLDVVLFRKMPMFELAPLFFKVLQGNHPNNKNVLSFQTNKLRIESEKEISTDVDGEHGEKLPLEFSVLPKKLKIFANKEII